jgi:lipopolysaccharide/colanic/teichoic acid biosynthesis glycosyltransferase
MGERVRELSLLLTGDVLAVVLALWLTLLVRYLGLPSAELFSDHLWPFLIVSTLWLLVFYLFGLYDKHTLLLKKSLLSRLLYAQAVNGIVAALSFLVVPFGITPKTTLVIFLGFSSALLIWWRIWLSPRCSPHTQHRAILIADGPAAIELVDEINNNDRYNYYFVRIIDAATLEKTESFESKLRQLLERERITVIVADARGKAIREFLPVLFNLSFLQFAITFLDFNRLYEDTFDRVPLETIDYDWFIANISQTRSVLYDGLKRGIDIVGALMLLLPFAVIFPVVAAAIFFTDRGPLFYTTVRVGQYNRPITLYKFRTKNGTDSAEAALRSTLVDTKIGKFLRQTRIDELPQLLNVLRGDLSFVGPRPEIPSLAAVYAQEIPFYNSRHLLKPGLSGWAQIKDFDAPRGGVDVVRTTAKLSHDLFYLARRSLVLDIQIALKTLSAIIMRTGA